MKNNNNQMANPFDEIKQSHEEIREVLKRIETQKLPPPPPEERFLNQKEVAKLYGVTTVTVWAWETEGFIQSYRIGKIKLYRYSELMAAPKLIKRANKKKVANA